MQVRIIEDRIEQFPRSKISAFIVIQNDDQITGIQALRRIDHIFVSYIQAHHVFM